ncbi:MAG TPA: hypothetical protein VE735_09160, partial [Gammaproteobacteria bacterium]|nr:hypothetical protein [Gammaproteobacteria bacterium]
PVLVALLLKLRVAEFIDKHFPTDGNRTGWSLGQMCIVWLTFILSQADHRLNPVEPWVAEHRRTLSRCLGCEVEPRDCTDDRLATGLDYLSVGENWQSFEAELNGAIRRTYDLKTDRVRFDSTSASAYITPEGMFQFGLSCDPRPDLPQLKISLSVLDAIGLPLTTPVVAGNSADDPLYLPEIAKVRQSIGHNGLTHIGDGKMAALATRAEIVAHGDYYLCPLSALQMPGAELDRLLEPVFAGQQPLVDVYPLSADDAAPAPEERMAVGFETTVGLSGPDSSGKTLRWDERRRVLRSLSFAKRQEHSLRNRVKRAQAGEAPSAERRTRSSGRPAGRRTPSRQRVPEHRSRVPRAGTKQTRLRRTLRHHGA